MVRQIRRRRSTLRQHTVLEDVTETRSIDHAFSSGNPISELDRKCGALRSQLMHLKGLDEYLSILVLGDGDNDPARNLKQFLDLGLPLCRVWNIFASTFYPTALIDMTEFNEAESDYARMIALSLFATRMRVLEECPMLTLSDLLGSIAGHPSEKVVDALTILVSRIPEQLFNTKLEPLTQPKPPDVGHPPPPGWDGIVKDLVDSEHSYAVALNLVQSFAKALSDHQALDEDTIQHVFPKKLFTFQRKFLIRLENTAQLPWHAQRWGRRFLDNEGNFAVTYRLYCVNSTLAKSDLRVANEKLNGKFKADDITTALDRPLKRLSEYCSALTALRACISNSSSRHSYYGELFHAYTCTLSLHTRITEAQRGAKTDQVAGDLSSRINDWKGYNIAKAGFFLLHGHFTARQGHHSDVEQQLFLFDEVLLWCNEPPRSASRRRRQSSFSFKPKPLPNDSQQLQIEQWMPISEIEDVLGLTAKGSSSKGSQEKLLISYRGKHIKFICETAKQKRQWETELHRLRASKRLPTASGSQPSRALPSIVKISQASPTEPPSDDVPTLSVEPPTPGPTQWDLPRSPPDSSTVGDALLAAPRRSRRSHTPSSVKVKFHLAKEICAMYVPRNITFDALRHAVLEKRLKVAGAPALYASGSSSVASNSSVTDDAAATEPWAHPSQVRLRYVDEDGLMVAVVCTEDVEMAFGARHAVTFHVETDGA